MTNEETINIIRSWKGTKWIHSQSLKGVGVDCIQFVVSVGKELNWLPSDYKTIKYTRDWAIHNDRSILLEELNKVCNKIPITDLQIGDILVFKFGKCAGHSGFYIGNNRIVHSKIRAGVIEEVLNRKSVDSVWRVKNGLI